MMIIRSGSSGFPDGNNPGFEFDNDFADSGEYVNGHKNGDDDEHEEIPVIVEYHDLWK